MNDETKRPEVHREIATTGDGRDITRGFTGPLFVPNDRVLRNRGGGDLVIYEEVLSDPQVQSTFQQRRLAVTKCEWKVEPASERRVDKKAALFLEQQLRKIGWDQRTERMLFGVFYGYAVAEIIYGTDGSMVTLEAIKVRNRRRFRFGSDGTLRLLTPSAMLEGELAEAPYFWHYATGADNDDEPYGLGLAHWCYWPVLFKRNGIKFWLMFCEKFGMPTGVGKYDAAASESDKLKLLAAVRAIQTDSGIIMPKEMELELLEASRSGTVDYKALHDTMDETIAKITIGQTLTSNTSQQGGNRALGEVHQDVKQDLVQADADLIDESFMLGPATWLTRWNFPDADVPKVTRETEPPEDLTERAKRDQTVVGFGFKPTLDYVKETYGGEWVEKVPEKPDADDADALPPVQAADDASFAEPDTATAGIGELVARASRADVERWAGEVREQLEHAPSLEAFRDALLARFTDLPTADLTRVMGQALAAGNLAGRTGVLEAVSGAEGDRTRG